MESQRNWIRVVFGISNTCWVKVVLSTATAADAGVSEWCGRAVEENLTGITSADGEMGRAIC